jgi:putative transposase
MYRAFQFRLNPTCSQRTTLDKTLDLCQWVYNEALSTRKNSWENESKAVRHYDTIKMIPLWKKQKPELTGVYSQVLQEVCTRVDLAYQSFFRRVKSGEKPGYPRFKSKGRYDSFTFPQSGFRIEDNHLFLSKIGSIKIVLHRQIEGKCKTLTISKDSVGNWYASFLCVVESHPLPESDKVVGIDLGLTTFSVLSNGDTIKRERWMKRDKQEIARLQRKKELLPKGSKERHTVIRALLHAYQRQTNRRKNFAHQESRKLVNKYQFIAFEDLNIVGMQSTGNKIINQGIADVAWDQFVQFTIYKAEDAGRGIVLVDPRNTTKMCSRCGNIVPKDLNVRQHVCPHCGLNIGRDLNASLNILARGLASLRQDPVKSETNCFGVTT